MHFVPASVEINLNDARSLCTEQVGLAGASDISWYITRTNLRTEGETVQDLAKVVNISGIASLLIPIKYQIASTAG